MHRAGVFVGAAVLAIAANQVAAADDVMVVFDGSNSMWGQIEGTAKIEIARQAMDHLARELTDAASVGLMAYGHRRQGDCSDIETMIPPGPFDRTEFMARIGSITPKGKTPLTVAVQQAAEALSYRDNPATVVLITDGIESCQRDPCAVAEELARMGVGFTAHVIGFDLTGEEQEAIACVAERTGGRFISASNAGELGEALGTVGMAVSDASPADPEPEPEPEPAIRQSVTLTVPDSATSGSTFSVSWEAAEQAPRDYVTIATSGAGEGSHGDYTRVGDKQAGNLQAPAEPGLYEVRYVTQEARKTLAIAEIEIVAAQASVEAPDRATAGARFPVSWSQGIHPRDFVTIVPTGTPEGKFGDYTRVGDKTEGSLQAPADPGFYEVRYVLQEGNRTLAVAETEIVAAQASVRAPESAVVGSTVPVQWSKGIHPRDYVTIVALGANEGTHGDFTRVGDGGNGSLRAPAEPGLYEVRYVLQEGGKTVASAEMEIVEADIELDGSTTARAGTDIRVAWSGTPPHPRDYITIVPMGAEEGAHGNFIRVSNRDEVALEAPEETGLYEIRYVLDHGGRVLARHMVEVVDETAALNDGGRLEAPAVGTPGETVEVRWTADSTTNDQRVTLARPEQADFTWVDVQQAGEDALTFTLPEQPGFYEFRLLDVTARRVLSRVMISVE